MKMMKGFGRAGRALLLAMLWPSLQPVLADDFEVEVIVFRHTAQAAAGTWAASETGPALGSARRLADAEEHPAPDAEPMPFTKLPSTAHRLAGADRLLAGSSVYEVVSHTAWRQPGDAGVAVYLGDEAAMTPEAAAAPDAGLGLPAPVRPRAEGMLRLQVDATDMRVGTDFTVLAGETPLRVRATRNLRSGELHYLDHEVLGILLQVTPMAPASSGAPPVSAPEAVPPAPPLSD